MARWLVTGSAGFIGSTLSAALLARGDSVIGIDSMNPYYDLAQKHANLHWLDSQPETKGTYRCQFDDLGSTRLDDLVESVDGVFHLAGQPGVRASWGNEFDGYVKENVIATSRLLETIKRSARRPRLVYASSSSIYGRSAGRPVAEDSPPSPRSPYGVSKLAGEHLCTLFAAEHGIDCVSLRLFTVYGPRQRPDMAVERLIRCALTGDPFFVNGDGSQARDFTFVSDVVEAFIAAATAAVAPGSVFNITSGQNVELRTVIDLVGALVGRNVPTTFSDTQAGDPQVISGDNGAASRLLSWVPQTSVDVGIARQVEWANGPYGFAHLSDAVSALPGA